MNIASELGSGRGCIFYKHFMPFEFYNLSGAYLAALSQFCFIIDPDFALRDHDLRHSSAGA